MISHYDGFVPVNSRLYGIRSPFYFSTLNMGTSACRDSLHYYISSNRSTHFFVRATYTKSIIKLIRQVERKLKVSKEERLIIETTNKDKTLRITCAGWWMKWPVRYHFLSALINPIGFDQVGEVRQHEGDLGEIQLSRQERMSQIRHQKVSERTYCLRAKCDRQRLCLSWLGPFPVHE